MKNRLLSQGLFLTFEGLDGAGKSTLIEAVYQKLGERGYELLKTRAPGGCLAGQAIREVLLHKKEIPLFPRAELLLFLADRAQHVEEVITPALKQGKIVLCDRFNDSTIAYQGGARGLEKEKVKELCSFASCALVPHLTLCLDVDPKIAFERLHKKRKDKPDRIEEEDLSFHLRIRNAFQEIAKKEPKRFYLLDGSLTPEVLSQKAIELIDALL